MLNVSHSARPDFNWRERSQKEAEELLDRYFTGSNIDVTKPIDSLSLTDRQIVEICKTLMDDKLKILILDEPTSALSSDKAEQLHKIVKELSNKGIAVIYISHKLDEIRVVSDRIVILSNGQNKGEFYTDEISQAELVDRMGGTSEKKERIKRDLSKQPEVLSINDLSTHDLDHINITLKKGEIIGISELAGSGQQELLQIIYDSRKKHRKEVALNGTIAYVSGDRTTEGVFPFWSIKNNILVANFDRVRTGLRIDKSKADHAAKEWYEKLKFRAEGIESNIMSFSGGNQQKALIARGIASDADIIILNDPTAGVDIGTKQDIYALLAEVREMGKSVILYSTEDAEMEICDRVYIMRDGCITKELHDDEISVPEIVKASFIETKKRVVKEKKKEKMPIFYQSHGCFHW